MWPETAFTGPLSHIRHHKRLVENAVLCAKIFLLRSRKLKRSSGRYSYRSIITKLTLRCRPVVTSCGRQDIKKRLPATLRCWGGGRRASFHSLVYGFAERDRTGVGLTGVRALSEVNDSLQVPRASSFSSVQVHPVTSRVPAHDDDDVELHVLGCRWTYIGTNCDQCVCMVQCCFTSTETIRLIRTGSPVRLPRLSHSS